MDEAGSIVEKVSGHMGEMSKATVEISKTSEETGKIVKTIDEIATASRLVSCFLLVAIYFMVSASRATPSPAARSTAPFAPRTIKIPARSIWEPSSSTIPCKSLTPQEIQIAELIRQGKRSKEIAALFGLSVGTVITHRNNIRKKLNLSSRDANLRSHLLSLT